MPSPATDRISWAISRLAVTPGDRLLEIGCGTGMAMAVICQRLRQGRITGIDRSATAVAAAGRRLANHLEDGRARLTNVALADFTTSEGRFDKVFAINVNVFWLSPARELRVVREVLSPRGRLYLFFEPPSHSQVARILSACTEFLQLEGYSVADVVRREPSSKPGLGIIAVANV
jgi:cyclopropane fatty-acyl-phospholipid synthase-like methyltransferase